MTKNERIRQTLIETQKRRQNQILKVYEVKVDCHHVSKEDFKKLNHLFVETKWIQNDVIASNDIFKYDYKQHRKIINFDRDKNEVERNITIQTGVHQAIIKQIQQDICNLSKSKKKGRKVGRLKFRRNCSNIPLKTGMLKTKSSKQISIPSFRKLNVYGLEQFINLPEYEIANANIVKKASGIYIKISVFIPKQSIQRKSTGKTVGLDFGIKDNIITSDGEKFNCSVQESDYLKFLQRKLSKKQKGSKRYYRCLNQIQKEHEHLTNKKNNAANKLVANLLKNYDMIYFQDENLVEWKKKKFSKKTGRKLNQFSFGRQVQSSYLGRVKAKLVQLENSRTFKISKWSPTTKLCPNCGCLNEEITLDERFFKCDCGYSQDRDVHAAKNVKLFGSTKRAECLEQASVETLASATSA